ncbi:MAG: ABC transporter permease, partial [Bacteroidota bacterium]|nr:ABC transporter permease [Bacteroidota bacterium]
SLVGGIFGLLLVLTGTVVMRIVLDVNITLTFGNIFKAMCISGIIGVISGYSPAQSASKLDPVEAMGATF